MAPLHCENSYSLDGKVERLCYFTLRSYNLTLNKCTQVPRDLLETFKSALESSCSTPIAMVPEESSQSCPDENDIAEAYVPKLAICKKGPYEQDILTTDTNFYKVYCPSIVDKMRDCFTVTDWNNNQFNNDVIIPAVVIIAVLVAIRTACYLYDKRVEYNKRPERKRLRQDNREYYGYTAFLTNLNEANQESSNQQGFFQKNNSNTKSDAEINKTPEQTDKFQKKNSNFIVFSATNVGELESGSPETGNGDVDSPKKIRRQSFPG